MKLYHYWRSSASWRVRMALEIKKISTEKVHINLLKGEEKQVSYLEKNPSGYLPALVLPNGTILGESVAIMEWLDEEYPEKPFLLPMDKIERAYARQLVETINSGIQPLQNLDVIKKISSNKDEQEKWSQLWIYKGLSAFEETLKKFPRKNGPYCLGHALSIVDCCLMPQLYSATRNNIDLSKYPLLLEIAAEVEKTSEWQVSHPDKFKPSDA
ncbi:MAG: maleylacetoacetate isomerase [Oligoflexia bacterium]|nr:maleylacetoacetate isomerase [Oligoflexia bacterium]